VIGQVLLAHFEANAKKNDHRMPILREDTNLLDKGTSPNSDDAPLVAHCFAPFSAGQSRQTVGRPIPLGNVANSSLAI
jgi:hypothetical protein